MGKNKEKFINKCFLKFGNKFDYSKVEYKNNETKVCIICSEHGPFWITPHNFLRTTCGCPMCYKQTRKPQTALTTEEFINRAKVIHGDKYDYSKVEYKNSFTKVCIICPEHGPFWTKPSSHLRGCNCKKCSIQELTLTTEEFINRAKVIHGDKYDYSKVEYKNGNEKVCIICPEHGPFLQMPFKHLSGSGCYKCGLISMIKSNTSNAEEFIKKAKEVHGNKYDYSKVEYKGATWDKVCIICPEHGPFWQTPCNHLHGDRCPSCNISKLEETIIKFLTNNNIKYEHEKKFNWLGKQRLDFYLPEYNVAIECQGNQHFKSIEYFGGNKSLNYQIKNDIKKFTKCLEHNIKLFYYIPDESIIKNLNNNLIYKNNNIISDENIYKIDTSFFTK